MKKISLKSVKDALSRDEMRVIAGGGNGSASCYCYNTGRTYDHPDCSFCAMRCDGRFICSGGDVEQIN